MRLVEVLSGNMTALTGVIDVQIRAVDHTAIVRAYFSLIPNILQVRRAYFAVFFLLRKLMAALQ